MTGLADPATTGVPFGPIAGLAEPATAGVPFGPITGAEPLKPGASVGVPFGPITVGEVVIAGKPLASIVVVGEIARVRSVVETTRSMPSGPTVVMAGLIAFAPP